MSTSKLTPVHLLKRARNMRHEPAPAEMKLWQLLRNRQLGNFKFRRQTPLAPYIADFYCAEIKLIVELDGDSLAARQDYDARRTMHLVRSGMHVIRFLNVDVQHNIDDVLSEIIDQCERLTNSESPSP